VRHAKGMYFRNRSDAPAKICPECGDQVASTLAGVMASHWRENHIDVMPWHQAWPLLRDGIYVPYFYAKPKRRRAEVKTWLTAIMMRLAG